MGSNMLSLKLLAIATVICVDIVLVTPAQIITKKNRIVLPAYIPFTGNSPFDGSICKAAMQVAVDAVNSQTKMLADYAVEPIYTDEGLLSLRITESLIKFSMSEPLSQSVNNSNAIKSPVSLGSYFSPSCQYFGPVLHHIGMVFVGTGCGAPSLVARRDRYPNLYRLRAPGLNTVYLRPVLIKRLTSWSTIGIIAYADNIFDLGNAILFHEVARKIGVTVVWFDALSAVTEEAVLSLKSSKARVTVVDVSSISMVNAFLCLAFKHGIAGKNYVFIAPTSAYTDPTSNFGDSLPPPCTNLVLQEQYRNIIWLGQFLTANENYGQTALGYDLDEFERRLDVLTNKSRVPDYRTRHYCHDTMLESILALDDAERRLTAQNLSLGSASASAIMLATNDSVASIDFNSLRVGRAVYSMNRLEMDYEPMFVGLWKASPSRLQQTHTAYLAPNTSYSDYRNYYLAEKQTFIWPPTDDGKFPRDKAFEKVETLEVPLSLRIVVYSLAAVLSGCHALVAIFTIANRRSIEPVESVTCNFLMLTGCQLLNASVVVFVTSSYWMGNGMCLIKEALLIAGFAFLHGFAYAKAMQLSKFYEDAINQYMNPAQIQLNTISRSSNRRNVTSSVTSAVASFRHSHLQVVNHSATNNSSSNSPKYNFRYFARSACFILLNVILLGAWMAFTNRDHAYSKVKFDDVYDQASDTIIHRSGELCQSFYGIKWIFAVLALHLLLIVTSLRQTYVLRRIPTVKTDGYVNYHFLLLVNEIILLLASVFILLLISNPFSQLAIVSLATLIISASAGCFSNLKTVYALLCCKNNRLSITLDS